MLSIDCCKFCMHMYIYMAERVYNVMKTIKYHLLPTIRSFALEREREQIDSMTFEETHRFHRIIIFSFSKSFLYSLLIFRYTGRQAKRRYFCLPSMHISLHQTISKKSQLTTCVTLAFFFTLFKNKFFFVYFIRAFDLDN